MLADGGRGRGCGQGWWSKDAGCGRSERERTGRQVRIKYVELQVDWKPGQVGSHGRYHTDGWTARTFSRPVAAANSASAANWSPDDWTMECEIKSSDEIDVDGNPHFVLLPRGRWMMKAGLYHPSRARSHMSTYTA